jgi:hypothetical protein
MSFATTTGNATAQRTCIDQGTARHGTGHGTATMENNLDRPGFQSTGRQSGQVFARRRGFLKMHMRLEIRFPLFCQSPLPERATLPKAARTWMLDQSDLVRASFLSHSVLSPATRLLVLSNVLG